MRDVFVTSDTNFHKADKKGALIALGAARIERPDDVLSLIKLADRWNGSV